MRHCISHPFDFLRSKLQVSQNFFLNDNKIRNFLNFLVLAFAMKKINEHATLKTNLQITGPLTLYIYF